MKHASTMFVLATLLALAGCGSGGESSYVDPENRFSITMPYGWEARPELTASGSQSSLALEAMPTAKSLRKAKAKVEISEIDASEGATVSAARKVDLYVRGLKAMTFDFKLLNRDRVSRDRGIYDYLSFQYQSGTTPLRGEAWITIHRGKAYTLTLIGHPDEWPRLISDFKRMAASFKVRGQLQ